MITPRISQIGEVIAIHINAFPAKAETLMRTLTALVAEPDGSKFDASTDGAG